jgi:hypothetical protein
MKRIPLPLLWSFAAMLVALLFTSTAEASHFRFGTISWNVPDPMAAPRTVRFVVQHAWRAGAANAVALNFGDGTSAAATLGTRIGTGTDVGGASYEVYEFTVTRTYATAGTFTAFFDGCCRVSGLANGASASFRIEAVVSLVAGNTGGPATSSTSTIALQAGGARTYVFPASDPDLDPVTCRFGTAAEVGFASPIPAIPAGGATPSVMTVAGGCQVSWNLAMAVAGQRYVLHLILESTRGGVTSKAPLDLIVEIIGTPPPTCAGSATIPAPVGTPIMRTVTGTTGGMAGESLSFSQIGAPSGMTFAPVDGTSRPSPFAVNITWTPGLADQGRTYVVLTNFRDPRNATGSCALSYQVPLCSDFGTACTVGVGACQRMGMRVCSGIGMSTCNVTPGAPSTETCNGIDDDCDGMTDESNAGCMAPTPFCSGARMRCEECRTNADCPETRPVCSGMTGSCTDPDSDGDGIPDRVEVANRTNPMNPDSDMDGVPDGREYGPGPMFTPRDTDMDMVIDALDPDDDGDGVNTRDELGPGGIMSPLNTDAMVPMGEGTSDSIPNYLDPDDDGDGIPTRTEVTAEGMTPPDMDMVAAYLDRDSDGDGVPDAVESGMSPTMPRDSDMDMRPDFLDVDDDGDSVDTADELGASGYTVPRNTDSSPTMDAGTADMIPDWLDPDDDGDGIPTRVEVMLDASMGEDFDGDGEPSHREWDSDGDGLLDRAEGTMDRDGNMRPDFLDPSDDSDGDGVPNSVERGGCGGGVMPGEGDGGGPSADASVEAGMADAGGADAEMTDAGAADASADGGGVRCVGNDRDTDGDGIPDFLDPDDDGDGIPTTVERSLDPSMNDDFDMDGVPSYRDLDSDGDSVPDATERGDDGAMPANTDTVMDGADFLDLDSDNDCVADRDMREAGAARTDRAMPSAMADSNCGGETPVCNTDVGRCVVCTTRAGASVGCGMAAAGTACLITENMGMETRACGCRMDSECAMNQRCDTAMSRCVARPVPDAGAEAGPEAGPEAGVDASDAAIEAGMDAGAPSPAILSGDGACACRVPAAPAQGKNTGAIILSLLGGVTLVTAARRRGRRAA